MPTIYQKQQNILNKNNTYPYTYQNNIGEEEWGQFDDLEKYDIFEIQKINIHKIYNKDNKDINKINNNDFIINIKNSVDNFCELNSINIEFKSLLICCRFWILFSVVSGTALLSSWFTKEELCEKDNK